jgi:hypothetical protein
MWLFQSPKQRVREVALKIIRGLADGTLVPDPPLAPDPPLGLDPGEALPQKRNEETCLSVFSTNSLTQGVYGSFIPGPPTGMSDFEKPKKRIRRGSLASRWYVEVTGGARQEIVRDALVQ